MAHIKGAKATRERGFCRARAAWCGNGIWSVGREKQQQVIWLRLLGNIGKVI